MSIVIQPASPTYHDPSPFHHSPLPGSLPNSPAAVDASPTFPSYAEFGRQDRLTVDGSSRGSRSPSLSWDDQWTRGSLTLPSDSRSTTASTSGLSKREKRSSILRKIKSAGNLFSLSSSLRLSSAPPSPSPSPSPSFQLDDIDPSFSPAFTRRSSIKGKEREVFSEGGWNLSSQGNVGLAIELEGAIERDGNDKPERRSRLSRFLRRGGSSTNLRDDYSGSNTAAPELPSLLLSPTSYRMSWGFDKPAQSPSRGLNGGDLSKKEAALPPTPDSSSLSSSASVPAPAVTLTSTGPTTPTKSTLSSRASQLRVDIPTSIPTSSRLTLSRAGRSNSASVIAFPLPSSFNPPPSHPLPRSYSHVALSSYDADPLPASRPSSPLVSPRSISPSTSRRPTLSKGFGAVAGLFSTSSSSSLTMLRSRSSSSVTTAPMALSASASTSEFGALFGGKTGSGGARRRGMSSSAIGREGDKGVGLPGGTSVGLGIPHASSSAAISAPTSSRTSRSRSSTDPSRRFSFSSTSISTQSSFPYHQHLSSSPTVNNSATSPVSPRGRVVRQEDETVESFLNRVIATVRPSDVGCILSSSSDPFYTTALSHYLISFSFASLPLDIALRKFLLEVTLPPETQQIDRLIEAFALRYCDCNPGLFGTPDTAHLLAFSLIMLGTDLWNKSNKVQMTKREYVKNTLPVGGDGVREEILEYFYDQLSCSPFVFGSVDSNQSRISLPEFVRSSSSGSFFSKTQPKIDPYHLISQNLVDDFKLDIERRIPSHSTFSFTGTNTFLHGSCLHLAFSNAPTLQLIIPPPLTVLPGDVASPVEGAPLTPITSNSTFTNARTSNLKIVKISALNLKEDVSQGGVAISRGNRSWRRSSVCLTASQLLIFRDSILADHLELPVQNAIASRVRQILLPPKGITSFKPSVISLRDIVAIYDSAYSRHPFVLRLVLRNGRQYLLQTRNADELNAWIGLVNYGATFKSAGINIRKEIDQRGVDLEARSNALLMKISHYDASILAAKTSLQSQLSIARNLAVLTPFQKSTRERLESAIEPVQQRIRSGRLHLARLVCYRSILSREMVIDDDHSPPPVRPYLTSSPPSSSSTLSSKSDRGSINSQLNDDDDTGDTTMRFVMEEMKE